jgi:hypothetical protein
MPECDTTRGGPESTDAESTPGSESSLVSESLGLTVPEEPGRSDPHETADTRKTDQLTFQSSIE